MDPPLALADSFDHWNASITPYSTMVTTWFEHYSFTLPLEENGFDYYVPLRKFETFTKITPDRTFLGNRRL